MKNIISESKQWSSCIGLLFTLIAMGALPVSVNAASLEIVPGGIGDMKIIEGENTSMSGDFLIELNASCYGTNLRSVRNPLSPSSNVVMNVVIKKNATETTTVKVRFPASVVRAGFNGSSPAEILDPTPTGTEAVSAGNKLQVKLPFGVIQRAQVDTAGNINVEDLRNMIESVSFTQEGGSDGAYLGHNGTLSAKINRNIADNGGKLVITAAFPGQEGYCGGFHSPLMVFLSKDRPSFTGKSGFPVNIGAEASYWPESSAPGYFLAWDRDKDGKITSRDELFGSSSEHKNGFEKLRMLDTNKDGKINASDKTFASLLLWNDENGNGKSEKSELEFAKSKLMEISLDYNSKHFKAYGSRAELREIASVTYKGPKGKSQKGDIIDVWFAPYEAK